MSNKLLEFSTFRTNNHAFRKRHNCIHNFAIDAYAKFLR